MNALPTSAVGLIDSPEAAIEKPRIPTRAVPNFDLRGKSILDINCGTGKHFLHRAYKQAEMLAGIDTNPLLIDYGRANYPRLKLAVAPCETIPFNREAFDIVLSELALSYSNIPAAFREIHRVLKPHGLMHITMHGWKTQMRWLQALKRAANYCFRTQPWLRKSLEQAGFREIRIWDTPLGIMIQAVRN